MENKTKEEIQSAIEAFTRDYQTDFGFSCTLEELKAFEKDNGYDLFEGIDYLQED